MVTYFVSVAGLSLVVTSPLDQNEINRILQQIQPVCPQVIFRPGTGTESSHNKEPPHLRTTPTSHHGNKYRPNQDIPQSITTPTRNYSQELLQPGITWANHYPSYTLHKQKTIPARNYANQTLFQSITTPSQKPPRRETIPARNHCQPDIISLHLSKQKPNQNQTHPIKQHLN